MLQIYAIRTVLYKEFPGDCKTNIINSFITNLKINIYIT